jgi:hypothetical protein
MSSFIVIYSIIVYSGVLTFAFSTKKGEDFVVHLFHSVTCRPAMPHSFVCWKNCQLSSKIFDVTRSAPPKRQKQFPGHHRCTVQAKVLISASKRASLFTYLIVSVWGFPYFFIGHLVFVPNHLWYIIKRQDVFFGPFDLCLTKCEIISRKPTLWWGVAYPLRIHVPPVQRHHSESLK